MGSKTSEEKVLTEDAKLKIAYADHPNMILRLCEFSETYSLLNRPALVVQARPIDQDFEIDVMDDAVRNALQRGNGGQNGWWSSFHSNYVPDPTFRGVAAVSQRGDPDWSYELHRDGHLIAGLWKFPELSNNGTENVSCVADFHVEFFCDFVEAALRVLKQAACEVPYSLTATLLGASDLYFAAKSDFGSGHKLLPPCKQARLYWRVRTVDSPDTWRSAARMMGGELVGAYGRAVREES
ncbi:hypothetical protein [Burkholderia sp. PU8-34]